MLAVLTGALAHEVRAQQPSPAPPAAPAVEAPAPEQETPAATVEAAAQEDVTPDAEAPPATTPSPTPAASPANPAAAATPGPTPAAEPAEAPAPQPVVPGPPPSPPTPAAGGDADAEPGAREAAATGSSAHGGKGAGIHIAGFRLNGRFDLAYEVQRFAVDGEGDPRHRLVNYHHFLFLSRNRDGECCSVNVELIDLSFYELGVKLGDRAQVRFGKVFVPFGANPLFHHSYGGVSGFDQKLVPVIWTEHGAVLLDGDAVSLDNEAYAVTGISGDPDEVVLLSGAGDPGRLALGDRVRVGHGPFAAAGSIYWSRYADDFDLFIWGIDVSAGYGFLPLPVLDRLAVTAGFLRADVQGSRASGLGSYYHFGNYLQLDWRLPWTSGIRYRTGMVAMENHRGIFFDDRERARSQDDTVAHGLTLWKRVQGLMLSAELIVRIEQAGELDNDLFRLTAALDF